MNKYEEQRMKRAEKYNRMTTKLLAEMEKKIKNGPFPYENDSEFAALYGMFCYCDNIPWAEDSCQFTKAYRQCDITESGDLDMVFWNLLNCQADYFWKIFEKIVGAEDWS